MENQSGSGVMPVIIAVVGVIALGVLVYMLLLFIQWVWELLTAGPSQATPLSVAMTALALTILCSTSD